MKTNCLKLDNGWLITTDGDRTKGLSGVIGIYDCAPDDDACQAGDEPRVTGAWSFYTPPVVGEIKIFAFHAPDILVIDAGGAQMCFNITSRTYDTDPGCH